MKVKLDSGAPYYVLPFPPYPTSLYSATMLFVYTLAPTTVNTFRSLNASVG